MDFIFFEGLTINEKPKYKISNSYLNHHIRIKKGHFMLITSTVRSKWHIGATQSPIINLASFKNHKCCKRLEFHNYLCCHDLKCEDG